MSKSYDFSSFDNAVTQAGGTPKLGYDLSAFDKAVSMANGTSNALLSDKTGGRINKFLQSLAQGGQTAGNEILESGEDAAKGAIQGATLGGADEIYGLLKAAGNQVAQGKLSPNPEAATDITKDYRSGQEQANQFFQSGKERSPVMYGAGEIAGTVLPATLTTGAGLSAPAIRGAVGLGSDMALSELPGLVSKGGELATRALAGAAEQAPIGATMGALNSNGKLIGGTDQEQNQVINDTLSGALSGGLIGAGVNSFLPKGLPESAASTPKSQQGRLYNKAYQFGKQGVNLANEDVQNKLFRAPGQSADELIDLMNQADQAYGKKVGQSLQNAQDSGQTIDIGPQVLDLSNGLEKFLLQDNPNIDIPPRLKATMGKILNKDTDLTPIELKSLKDDLDSILDASKLDTNTGLRQVRSKIQEFRNSIDSTLKEQVPDYQKAATDFYNFRSKLPEQILSGSKPSETTGIMLGGLKNPDLNLRNKLEDLIQGATKQGFASSENRAAFDTLKDQVQSLNKSNPEAFQATGSADSNAFKGMGISPEDLIQKIKDKADESAMIQGITKTNPQQGPTQAVKGALFGLASTGKGLGLSIANKAGLAVKTVTKPLELGKHLYNASFDEIGNLGKQLAASNAPGAKQLGEALANGAANKDLAAKNAAVFTLLQNPQLRKLINVDDSNTNGINNP